MKQSWYEIKNKTDDEAEIIIYDEIGFFGISAKDFINDVKALPPSATIHLRINSPGGEVFDGIAIYNVLKHHNGDVNVTVDGLAASVASIIAMAGDHIAMPENAFMMIHNPWGIQIGDSEDMREYADLLAKIESSLVSTYVARTGQSQKKIADMMHAETWLTAAEAKELGFADEVTESVKMAASIRSLKLKDKIPEGAKEAFAENDEPLHGAVADPDHEGAYLNCKCSSCEYIRAQSSKPEPEKTPDEIAAAAEQEAQARFTSILAACAHAGVPEAAQDFINKKLSVDDVKAGLADAGAIRDACTAARVPDRANTYIKAGMNIAEVRADLFEVLQARDTLNIDNKIDPPTGNENRQKNVIDITKIYADRKAVARGHK